MNKQKLTNVLLGSALVVLALTCIFQTAQIRSLRKSVLTIQMYILEEQAETLREQGLLSARYLGVYQRTDMDVLVKAGELTDTPIWFGPAVDPQGNPLDVEGMVALYSTEGDKSDFWVKVLELQPDFYESDPADLIPKPTQPSDSLETKA